MNEDASASLSSQTQQMSPPITPRANDPIDDTAQQQRQPTDSPPVTESPMEIDASAASPVTPQATLPGEEEVIVQITREKVRSKLSVSRRTSSSAASLAILTSNWARSPSPSSSAHSLWSPSSHWVTDSCFRGRSEMASIFSHRAPFTGLDNLGNTCYINSLLQVLYYTPHFRQELRNLTNETAKYLMNTTATNTQATARHRSLQSNLKHLKSQSMPNASDEYFSDSTMSEEEEGQSCTLQRANTSLPNEAALSSKQVSDTTTAALEQEIRMLSAISRLFSDMEQSIAMTTNGSATPSGPPPAFSEQTSTPMIARSPSVRPLELVQLLRTGGGRFANEQQHDVQEFLRYLLAFVQKIEHEIERRKRKLQQCEENRQSDSVATKQQNAANVASPATSEESAAMDTDTTVSSTSTPPTPQEALGDSNASIRGAIDNEKQQTTADQPKRRRRRKSAEATTTPRVIYNTRRRARAIDSESVPTPSSLPDTLPESANHSEPQTRPHRKRKAGTVPSPHVDTVANVVVVMETDPSLAANTDADGDNALRHRRRKRQRTEPPVRPVSTSATATVTAATTQSGSPYVDTTETAFFNAAGDAAGFVERLFCGKLVNEVKCQECENSSRTVECFFDLSVPLAAGVDSAAVSAGAGANGGGTGSGHNGGASVGSVDTALAAFLATERLQGANKYACPHCRTFTEAVRSMRFCALPPILTLHIKRFFDDAVSTGMFYGNGGAAVSPSVANRRKLCQPILCPPVLSLSMTPVTNGSGLANGPIPVEYELFAVIFHSGYWLSSGHYFAFIKVPSGNSGNHGNASGGSWVSFDDSQVTFCSEAELNKLMRGTNGCSVADDKNTSYILFYKRVR